MIKIAVVDDERSVCSEIEKCLNAISNEYDFSIEINIYNSGKQICECLDKGIFYDLIFLDIEMGELSGIDVSETLRNIMKNESTQIAYISAKMEYAMEIFEYDPLYFLHKPLDREKIEKVFVKLIKRLHLNADEFSFKVERETINVPMKDIIYFESDDHRVVIHYYVRNVQKKEYFYGLLDHVQQQLETYHFLRIHKTYLVNPIHVKKYRYDKVIMSTEIVLPIAQSKRKEIRAIQFDIN